MSADCEHGMACHDGTEPSGASAPEASRAWLLIEHPGPWPHEATEAEMPPDLRATVDAAADLGVRVQLIRRPAGRLADGQRHQLGETRAVFAGWTAGREPWLRYAQVPASAGSARAAGSALPGSALPGSALPGELELKELSAGQPPAWGVPVTEPVFLVCTHSRRSACCARFGLPLAQALAGRHPGQVWETSHVGGHRFAANLVLLPHGLYYGPVDLDRASTAIAAYASGTVEPARYRGRAGQPKAVQEAEHERLAQAGALDVTALA